MSLFDKLKAASAQRKAEEGTATEAKPNAKELLQRVKARQKELENDEFPNAVSDEEAAASDTEEKTLQEQAEAVVESVLEKSVPVKNETAPEEPAPSDEEEEQPVHEEAPKKRRGRKKKTEVEGETKADSPSYGEGSDIHAAECQTYDVFGKKFSYDEMAGIALDYFEDDDWKETEKDLTEKIAAIRIEPDMNPGTLKYALAALNNLYDEVSIVYDEQCKLINALCEKDFGAATAYQAIHSVGENAEARKRNGFLSLMKAKIGDTEINYVALIAATKMRHAFTSNLIRRIQAKANFCITMSGAIKMEQTMVLGQ